MKKEGKNKNSRIGKCALLCLLTVIVAAVAICGMSVFASGIVTDGEMIAIAEDFAAYKVQDTARIENDGIVGAMQYTVYYDYERFGNVVLNI